MYFLLKFYYETKALMCRRVGANLAYRNPEIVGQWKTVNKGHNNNCCRSSIMSIMLQNCSVPAIGYDLSKQLK